jgi:hypothetical protein
MTTRSPLDEAPEFGGFAADLASILSAPTSPEMDRRIQDERRATRTPKQRARKVALRTEQVNFRVEPEHREILAALAKKLDVSATDVFLQALMDLAKQHKIKAGP